MLLVILQLDIFVILEPLLSQRLDLPHLSQQDHIFPIPKPFSAVI